MQDDLISQMNLTQELLASVYEAAFMNCALRDNGTLVVEDQIKCFVIPSERKDRIQLITLFRFRPEATEAQRLECVNNINQNYILVTASVDSEGTLKCKYDLFVEGGITRKNLVLGTKLFMQIPIPAIQDQGRGLIA